MKQFLTSSLVLMYLVAWLPAASVTHALDAPSTCGIDSTTPACIYFTTTGAGNTVPLDSSGNFTVTVKVNTGNRDSSGAEVRVQFITTQADFVSGEFPTGNDSTGHPFYPYKFGTPSDNGNGVIIMNRIVDIPGAGQPVIYTKGIGTFANLTFKPKTGVTQVDLSFIYTRFQTAFDSSVASSVSGEGDILGYAPPATLTITSAPNPTGVLNHVDIAPVSPTVAPSGTIQFTATAHDASHNAVTATYAWSQTGEGSISPATGATTTFTAGANTGTATVTVTATQTSGTGTITKSATANVTISSGFDPDPDPVGPNPSITSISPSSGQKDSETQVTITGRNFGAFDATSKVYFGMAEATILDWSNSRIVVRVPAAPDATAKLTVTVRALTSDDKTAEYLGYTYTMTGGRLPDNGPETYTWIGLLMAAFGFAGLAYLKLSGQPTSSRL